MFLYEGIWDLATSQNIAESYFTKPNWNCWRNIGGTYPTEHKQYNEITDNRRCDIDVTWMEHRRNIARTYPTEHNQNQRKKHSFGYIPLDRDRTFVLYMPNVYGSAFVSVYVLFYTNKKVMSMTSWSGEVLTAIWNKVVKNQKWLELLITTQHFRGESKSGNGKNNGLNW